MSTDFNENSAAKANGPQFIYKRNPLISRGFQVFMYKRNKGSYEPVGEYTVLDADESDELSEKKIINIISLLNGRKTLIDLGNLTQTRVLFNIVDKQNEDDPTTIIFRSHDGSGPSTENAVLVLEKGILDESQINV